VNFLIIFIITTRSFYLSFLDITLITLAGLPATIDQSGTSFVTTLPAPTVAPFPIVTPFKIVVQKLIHAYSFIKIDFV
jgi:hypothetical protein